MFEFDPHSPYHRRMWHYDSDRPLSVAQLIALGSLDPRTAALLWLLIERHTSVIVSGPTDPTPGVGKTTTLNALLGFLPAGSTLVYTMGMFEDFAFRREVDPATTCVLSNEVSDHLRIYMWGRVARKLLRLPQQGYAIATSCHADTIDDVMAMLYGDLHLNTDDVRHLGLVINIGLVGRVWPPRRRFLTVHLLDPEHDIAEHVDGEDRPASPTSQPAEAGTRQPRPRMLSLASWNVVDDAFIPADDATLARVAQLLGMTDERLCTALNRREARLRELSEGRGAGVAVMREAVDALHEEEQALATEPPDQTQRTID